MLEKWIPAFAGMTGLLFLILKPFAAQPIRLICPIHQIGRMQP
jgi:hypothetical protein